jgi:oligopeptide/dipeptide ABC transporter ATP-binding protein
MADQPEALVEISGISKTYRLGGVSIGRRAQLVRAVDEVSLTIRRGEVLSLVGESGSGKTTLGRSILRLIEPSAGTIRFAGQDITRLSRRRLRRLRARMQLIFQDPYASLNPRMTVERIIAAPLIIQGLERSRAGRRARVAAALAAVGLPEAALDCYPHEFSGGQRQRIGIARALILRPEFLVADEPVSALDMSIQAQVINLLIDLKSELGLTILFIAHDLAVVGRISDRIAVMYLGRIVEIAPTAALFRAPRHPYTEALFSAVPIPDPAARRQRILLPGDLPSAVEPPSGCAFRTRCRYAVAACATVRPPLKEIALDHFTACIRNDLVLQAPVAA